MTVEQRIDDLIEAGWSVLNSDFDDTAFANWCRKALDCVLALAGPLHPYTLYFRDFVEEAETKSLLAGQGILIAAKEQIATTGFQLGRMGMTGQTKNQNVI